MTDTATEVLARNPARLSSLAEYLLASVRARRLWIELALATAFYFGFACYLTWPLVTDLRHAIYGAPGDLTGTIAVIRELVDHHRNPFLPGTLSQFVAPEGQPIPWPRNLASAPEVTTLYLLTAALGATAAVGVYVLAGYTLTGLVTFLFTRRLTENTWASLIAGWAFAFYPFAALNGQFHVDNVHGWVFMLGLWRLVELAWRPTRRNGLLAGLAVVLAMSWSAYFILLMGVAYLAATAATLLIAAHNRTLRKILVPQLVTALIVAIFAGFLGALTEAGSAGAIGTRTQSLHELFHWAGHPFEFVIPDDRSPLLGSYTHPYLYSLRGVPTQENTLYVGITVILLAIAAFVGLTRRRLSPRVGRATLLLWVVVLAAFFSSLAPEITFFGVSIPFPARLIAEVTTTWRVYSRFVMIVMAALAVLAAVGLDLLTRGRRPWARVAIMACATIIVPLDLWWPVHKPATYVIPTPPIYQFLAHQPPGVVAEYPFPSIENTYADLLYEYIYNKPMLNGYVPESVQGWRAAELSNLGNPLTPPRLAALGVKYVLLDSKPFGARDFETGEPGAGLKLIASEPYGRLYLVTAHPQSPAVAAAGEGFSLGFSRTGNHEAIALLEHPSGKIEVAGNCKHCRGNLDMHINPVGVPRRILIYDSHGHELRPLPSQNKEVTEIPLSFDKSTEITITTTPGPRPVPGLPEYDVSIEVSHLEFTAQRKPGDDR